MDIWNCEEEASEWVDVPDWVEQDITPRQIAAIVQGGCASGAYMPAVTYYDAAQTMAKHGDDVLQYIQEAYGELPRPSDAESWSGLACFYLSCAVEIWASGVAEKLEAIDEDEEEGDSDE